MFSLKREELSNARVVSITNMVLQYFFYKDSYSRESQYVMND